MNTGTRIRGILGLIILINEALIRAGTIDFGNEVSNQIYKWISLIFLIASYIASYWYNNDFTVEMDTYTKLGRQAKALHDFAPETEEEPEDAEVDDGEE